MTTYERALEIVHEAYDGQITEIIANIDINRANLAIAENEFRNTLAFLLDEAYYLRNISGDPPDQDVANIIATRFRSTLPSQEIQRVNDQRNGVIEELYDSNFITMREIYAHQDEYIFQSGIGRDLNISDLRESILNNINFDAIIELFITLGAILPKAALIANLNLYYTNPDTQRINRANEEEIQRILDKYITEIKPEEDEVILEHIHIQVNVTDHNEGAAEPIGLAGDFFCEHSS